MELWLLILQALWLIAPAYAANAFPPLVKGKTPIDMGKNLLGKRLFGDGKTIEGSIAGISFGIFIGVIQILGQASILYELQLMEMTLPIAIALSCGAILGDITGSFIKRRTNIERGAPVPILDQLDFIAVSLLMAGFLVPLALPTILILLVLTPPIHWIANIIGFTLKIKKNPW